MISTCGRGEPVDVNAIPPDLSELPLLCKGCGVTLPPGSNNTKYCTLGCYHKNRKPQASIPSQSASPALRGEKRGQDDRSPVLCPLGLNPNLNAKEGRTSVSHFLSDPELFSSESLDAQQLIAKLKLSVALLSQQEKSLNEKVRSLLKDQERDAFVLKQEQTIKALECTSAKQVVVISELEESVAKLKSDIVEMKIAFADSNRLRSVIARVSLMQRRLAAQFLLLILLMVKSPKCSPHGSECRVDTGYQVQWSGAPARS